MHMYIYTSVYNTGFQNDLLTSVVYACMTCVVIHITHVVYACIT